MHRFLMQDKTFRELDIPLQPAMYRELEKQIKKSVPINPVPVWQGCVLMGYDRYNLCLKHHRIYNCKEIFFPRKSEAIAWVCREQLKRTDLSKAATCWLLYRLYEAILDTENRKAAKEQFQYKKLSPSSHSESSLKPVGETTAVLRQVGDEFGYDKQTIRNYIKFGKNLDRLEDMFPGVRIRILKGEIDVALLYMDALMDMPSEQLGKMIKDPECRKLRPPKNITEQILQTREARRKRKIHIEKTIKETPAYDPDAELNGLTYTISAWIKAIKRTGAAMDLQQATDEGKMHLLQALNELRLETDGICRLLEDNRNE